MARGKKSENPELKQVESESNDLNDEQKAKLFMGGIEKLEKLIGDKDWAVTAIRNHRKTMKSEGFSREEVEYALWSRKEGDERAKEAMAMQLRIAEWLGKPLGFQPSLDLAAAQ